jgi:hypothetical protein
LLLCVLGAFALLITMSARVGIASRFGFFILYFFKVCKLVSYKYIKPGVFSPGLFIYGSLLYRWLARGAQIAIPFAVTIRFILLGCYIYFFSRLCLQAAI